MLVSVLSHLPSIQVLEVGDSESLLTQLKIDAKLWLEHMVEVSQFLSLLPLTAMYRPWRLISTENNISQHR